MDIIRLTSFPDGRQVKVIRWSEQSFEVKCCKGRCIEQMRWFNTKSDALSNVDFYSMFFRQK